ncbi:MAG: type IV pilin protein, partial [Pseudomonadota bacterium]
KWYLQNNTYTTSLADLQVEETQNGYYNLSVSSADPVEGFTATATIKSGGAQEGDDNCDTFTIDATGALGAESSGGADTTVQCWR